ncbi:MAG: zinc carboxypeptidase [Bacteroidetes bacterium]|nr:zinc carboxypeptidase [Bacteroidota bacterium]
MKRLLAILSICPLFAAGQDLSYYLPRETAYDNAIPTPEKVIGHKVGEWHVTHDRLVQYMRAIDQASDRVTLTEIGTTYEGRPQVVLTITSPANHARLESIRQEHLKLSQPSLSASAQTQSMPVVVWIGCSIHGNESSGANASLLGAYHLAAAKGPQMDSLLDKVIILLDPSFNPDGLQRFSTWVNSHKSLTAVSDPNAREFNEAWPGGRFNHYWFDLNRDWLPAQHHESRNRLKVFHAWKPNILTDHHEMGTNATFFFQPGEPARVNANTPRRNQELTAEVATYHARHLDRIGSLYFTKEGFDDFYYGKGSTYPDVNGGIGILFEQASSRGHVQESINGPLSFPFTIRNQFTTMLSTLDAARNMRKKLLDYQRDFYLDAAKEAASSPVKAYLFGDPHDPQRTAAMINMLLRHQIEIYPLRSEVSVGGQAFPAAQSFIVPTAQPQSKLLKSMFERNTKFEDSLFYDISAWTIPLAIGIPFAELPSWNAEQMAGPRIYEWSASQAEVTRSPYAYVLDWRSYYAPVALYHLQSKGLVTKVATTTFEQGADRYGYGDIIVPVHNQPLPPDAVYQAVKEAQVLSQSTVKSIATGLSTAGVDLGSSSLQAIRKPQVMLFAGVGTSATDVGEIWHLFDQRYRIPASLVEIDVFQRADPSKYNIIIMPSGSYGGLGKEGIEKLRNWVSQGGTLVATEDAVQFLANAGLTKVSFRKDGMREDSTSLRPYEGRMDDRRAMDMPGSIFEAILDLTHPLCFGYTKPTMSLFKSNNLFMEKNRSAYNTPVRFTEKPLLAGYLHSRFFKAAPGAASVNVDAIGRGRVISMTENPNFRAFWFGTNRLLMNAVFFGSIVEAR